MPTPFPSGLIKASPKLKPYPICPSKLHAATSNSNLTNTLTVTILVTYPLLAQPKKINSSSLPSFLPFNFQTIPNLIAQLLHPAPSKEKPIQLSKSGIFKLKEFITSPTNQLHQSRAQAINPKPSPSQVKKSKNSKNGKLSMPKRLHKNLLKTLWPCITTKTFEWTDFAKRTWKNVWSGTANIFRFLYKKKGCRKDFPLDKILKKTGSMLLSNWTCRTLCAKESRITFLTMKLRAWQFYCAENWSNSRNFTDFSTFVDLFDFIWYKNDKWMIDCINFMKVMNWWIFSG